ncbi:MAG: response regulator transcription factor [Bacteroidales bacterium]|nr:response regulator transcription factor [Candidatus Colimorpha onthohippi]
MKILIIEDETIAAQNLKHLLAELRPNTEIVAVLQSIEEAIAWFESQPTPDLVFMDIHLADGISFTIFETIEIHCPIIFTTAYDQYALQAFKVGGIDYLLKPINRNDLDHSLHKLQQLHTYSHQQITNLASQFQKNQPSYKSHLLIPIAQGLQPLPVDNIAYLYLENKITTITTIDEKKYSIDKPLDSIAQQLNPVQFFRANRQFVIAHHAINTINYWLGSKLSITLSVPTPERIIISRARVADFKDWYTR